MSALRRALFGLTTLVPLACSRTSLPEPTPPPPRTPKPELDLTEDDSAQSITFEEIEDDAGASVTCGGSAKVELDLTELSGRPGPATMRAVESELRVLLTPPLEACDTQGYSGIASVTLELKDGGLGLGELTVRGPSQLRGCIEWEFQEAVRFDEPRLPRDATLDVEVRLDAPYCPTLTPLVGRVDAL